MNEEQQTQQNIDNEEVNTEDKKAGLVNVLLLPV